MTDSLPAQIFGGDELTFRVRLPDDAIFPPGLDFSGLLRFAVRHNEDGQLVCRFPLPFDDLQLTSGELLTPSKVSRLQQAWRYFSKVKDTNRGA